MELKEVLQPIVNAALTGQARSKALLEDYANVISQLTGDKPEDIIERINKRTEQIAKEFKESFPKSEE